MGWGGGVTVGRYGSTSEPVNGLRAEGARAEFLRNELAAKGVEDMANRWQQLCNNRFGHAKRVGATQYRDDRRRNQFFTAEVYEISGFLQLLPDRRRCQLQLPNFWMRQTILPPEGLERSAPLALPHPCQVVHILDIEFATLRPLDGHRAVRNFVSANPFFKYDRTIKSSWRFWTVSSAVETLADAVPADQMADYGGQVEALWSESSWTHDLPVGYPRLKGGKDFGCLPELEDTVYRVRSDGLPVNPSMRPTRRSKLHRSQRDAQATLRGLILLLILLAVAIYFVTTQVAKKQAGQPNAPRMPKYLKDQLKKLH